MIYHNNEELGYSRYDYHSKETDNSRNGLSRKTIHTSYDDMDVAVPRDRKGEYESQLIPKYQNTVTQGHGKKDHIYVRKRTLRSGYFRQHNQPHY